MALGVGHRPALAILSRLGRSDAPGVPLRLLRRLTVGVGKNPDSVAEVRGANGRRRYAIPLRIVPARGQVSENTSKPSTKES